MALTRLIPVLLLALLFSGCDGLSSNPYKNWFFEPKEIRVSTGPDGAVLTAHAEGRFRADSATTDREQEVVQISCFTLPTPTCREVSAYLFVIDGQQFIRLSDRDYAIETTSAADQGIVAVSRIVGSYALDGSPNKPYDELILRISGVGQTVTRTGRRVSENGTETPVHVSLY